MARAKAAVPSAADGPSGDTAGPAGASDATAFVDAEVAGEADERVVLPPEVPTGNIARVMMDDQPLGFEDMALKHARALIDPLPPPLAVEPPPAAPVVEPLADNHGITHTLRTRTELEMAAGRAAVARRESDHQRNMATAAREAANRVGGAARPDDLAYSAPRT